MRIFSFSFFSSIGSGILSNFRRFAFTTLSAIITSLLMGYLITYQEKENQAIIKLVLTGVLSISLFFGAEMLGERYPKRRMVPSFLVIMYLVVFYYIAYQDKFLFQNNLFVIKYIVLLVVSHLFTSVAPYIFHNKSEAFWHYNKSLFLNILTSLLYSIILGIGITLALLGVKELFDVQIKDYWFGNIWVALIGILNTQLFLNKTPTLLSIDVDSGYPLGLKYFTQYVLLPLVSLYLIILIAYEIKILSVRTLPNGWISIMVLLSAIFGILAFLLIFPLKKDNVWIKNFTKYYYFSLLPLILLMAYAIYIRINQYGVSEPRFYVASLSIWLLFISLYFIISKKDDIRVIPISLMMVGLWGVYSPLGAQKSSVINQKRRLVQTLEKYSLMKGGMILPNDKVKFNEKDSDKVFSAIEYLSKSNVNSLSPLLPEDIYSQLIKEPNEYNRFKLLTNYFQYPINEQSSPYRYFNISNLRYISLNKADYFIDSDQVFDQKIKIENKEFSVKLTNNKLEVFENPNDKMVFDFSSISDNFEENMSVEKLTFEAQNKNWKGKIILKNGNFRDQNLENVYWYLFLTSK